MKIIILLLVASVYAESQVRETETWIPKPKPEDLQEILLSSGDSPVDPDFTSDLDLGFDIDDDEDDEDYDMSGSGDGDQWNRSILPTTKLDVNDNNIPDPDIRSSGPPGSVDDLELVKTNEVAQTASADQGGQLPNVLMAHANDDIFKKTEVVAALIAGGSVGLVIAGLLILLLFYRLKKKDEGTYDLGKRPIYKKAATTEIYA